MRDGTLRLVDIGGFDLSACGGTHVSRTGEIGLIAVRAWERFKGGARLEFVCGVRALASLREFRDAALAASRQLSVLPGAGRRDRAAADGEPRFAAADARAERAACALPRSRSAARGERLGKVVAVVDAMAGYDAAGLKALAASIVSEPGRAAVLVTAERPALVVVSSQRLTSRSMPGRC